MQQTGMLYKGDDETYFSYAASIALFQFPSFKKELVKSPTHFIGCGVLAAPFVFAFSLIDRVDGSSITFERTAENVTGSWTLFGFVFASVFYFWIACFLLYRAIRLVHDEGTATLAVVLMVLVQGVPLYVYRRPVFTHVYEFFVQSALVYFLMRVSGETDEQGNDYLRVLTVGFLVGMVALVRFNNVPYALLWPLAIWGFKEGRPGSAPQWKNIFCVYGIVMVPFAIFILLPGVYNKEGSLMMIVLTTQNYASNIVTHLIRIFYFRNYHTRTWL